MKNFCFNFVFTTQNGTMFAEGYGQIQLIHHSKYCRQRFLNNFIRVFALPRILLYFENICIFTLIISVSSTGEYNINYISFTSWNLEVCINTYYCQSASLWHIRHCRRTNFSQEENLQVSVSDMELITQQPDLPDNSAYYTLLLSLGKMWLGRTKIWQSIPIHRSLS